MNVKLLAGNSFVLLKSDLSSLKYSVQVLVYSIKKIIQLAAVDFEDYKFLALLPGQ